MKSSSEYHFILVSETHGFELRLLTISCLSFRYKRYLKCLWNAEISEIFHKFSKLSF